MVLAGLINLPKRNSANITYHLLLKIPPSPKAPEGWRTPKTGVAFGALSLLLFRLHFKSGPPPRS